MTADARHQENGWQEEPDSCVFSTGHLLMTHWSRWTTGLAQQGISYVPNGPACRLLLPTPPHLQAFCPPGSASPLLWQAEGSHLPTQKRMENGTYVTAPALSTSPEQIQIRSCTPQAIPLSLPCAPSPPVCHFQWHAPRGDQELAAISFCHWGLRWMILPGDAFCKGWIVTEHSVALNLSKLPPYHKSSPMFSHCQSQVKTLSFPAWSTWATSLSHSWSPSSCWWENAE